MFRPHRDLNQKPSASQLIISCILIEEINMAGENILNFYLEWIRNLKQTHLLFDVCISCLESLEYSCLHEVTHT